MWLTIFSHGSSYLASLGISEVQISLIWTAAPVCGSIIHPVVGVVSDRSRISWGRRRPFILIGAIIIIIAITALAWIEPITLLLCSLHGKVSMAATVTLYWAVFWVIILNIGIQTLLSGSRSLIVDVCPSEQQSIASAWAARFTGLGNILGYLIGSVPLPFLASNHEAWRFRCMALFAATVLTITAVVTGYFIREENPQHLPYDEAEGSVFARTFRGVYQGLVAMPPKARSVCRVQFFTAMAWFGFLFYSTSYVSGLYLDESCKHGMVFSSALKDRGIRLGTTSSLLFAVAALWTNVLLPHIRCSPETQLLLEKGYAVTRFNRLRQTHILWTAGLILYVLFTLSTFFISSSMGGVVAVALVGLSWGITQWAPFALIGEEIAASHDEGASLSEMGGKTWATNQNGAMMGVHNAAVSVPQIMAAMASSFIFWLTGRFGVHDAVGWVLRFSGIAGAVAAWFAWQL